MGFFDFTKKEYEYIKENLMLNDEMSMILEMKIKGYSNVQIAMAIPLSNRTLSRRLKELKKKIEKVIWLLFFGKNMARQWHF